MESPRILAAKAGQRKYTGKPCKTCKSTLRYTVNCACVACTVKLRQDDHQAIKAILEKDVA